MITRYDIEMNGDDMIIDPSPDGDWVRFEDAKVEICSCEEALALREQLAEVRRLHDTDAVTCREALDREDDLRRQLDEARAVAEEDRVQLCAEGRARAEAWDKVEWLTRRVSELEDLGYAGALKLATAYADLNAVEGRLREAVGLLERWMADEDHAEDGSVRSETGSLLASAQPAAPAPRVGCPCGRCDTCWRNAGCPETPPPWGGEP